MTWTIAATFAALGAAATLLVTPALTQGDAEAQMQEAMKKAARFTQPGEQHKTLERFVGTWDMKATFFMGDKAMPAGGGKVEYSWLMPGRWLQARGTGNFAGKPLDQFHVLGYDNFKMSFVSTSVTNMDTAMNHAEGDLTPDGKALVLYGTLDEYLTGEHDKMVKYAYRFLDADHFTFEVHDLPIGETNTKVVEFDFRRAK